MTKVTIEVEKVDPTFHILQQEIATGKLEDTQETVHVLTAPGAGSIFVKIWNKGKTECKEYRIDLQSLVEAVVDLDREDNT